MNRKLIFCVLAAMFSNLAVYAQEDRQNSIGLSGLYAVVGYYSYVEYEHFLTDHSAIAARIGALGYSYEEDEYSEDGSGVGFGGAIRWYFGSQPMGGFFIGTGLEFVSSSWDYDDYYEGTGSGSTFSVAPTAQIGGRFNIGPVFYIAPSLLTGYFIGLSSESDLANDYGEIGFFGGPNLALGFRF